MNYGDAIRKAFFDELAKDERVVVIGQGLWSPWYVGNTMTALETEFGKTRVIDTPVSELATTGAGLGLALSGFRPVVTHPRVDFSLLALDQIVNQAAKWSSMFGGQRALPIVFRLIVNRGGEQGAQHSQSLYSWFAHIPGLRVFLPATPNDAYAMLRHGISGADPVVYIDDRWLYDWEFDGRDDIGGNGEFSPQVLTEGQDLTIVAMSWTTRLCVESINAIRQLGIEPEIIDLRCANPIDFTAIERSVRKTRALLVVEGDWAPCGLASEIITRAFEEVQPSVWATSPRRINLQTAPAPTSGHLEEGYYPTRAKLVDAVSTITKNKRTG